jgi:hypothetical protein
MRIRRENMTSEYGEHISRPGHDFRACRECCDRLKFKGITTLRTIVNPRRPEKDIIENAADLEGARA